MVDLLLQIRSEAPVRVVCVVYRCSHKDPVIVLEEVLLFANILGCLLDQPCPKEVEHDHPGILSLTFAANLLEVLHVAEFLEVELDLDITPDLVDERRNAAWSSVCCMLRNNSYSFIQEFLLQVFPRTVQNPFPYVDTVHRIGVLVEIFAGE
jgi:hypothetical protein